MNLIFTITVLVRLTIIIIVFTLKFNIFFFIDRKSNIFRKLISILYKKFNLTIVCDPLLGHDLNTANHSSETSDLYKHIIIHNIMFHKLNFVR